MRDIKFRAWDVESNEMTLPNDILEVLVSMKNEVYAMVKGRNETLGGINRDNTILMQYTGLKDSNDIEIYEGDIIWDAHAEIHGKVVFDEGAFCVEWDTHIEHLFEVVTDGYAEVVGSIYENPELMERGSDE